MKVQFLIQLSTCISGEHNQEKFGCLQRKLIRITVGMPYSFTKTKLDVISLKQSRLMANSFSSHMIYTCQALFISFVLILFDLNRTYFNFQHIHFYTGILIEFIFIENSYCLCVLFTICSFT